jgi:hypothetical protein
MAIIAWAGGIWNSWHRVTKRAMTEYTRRDGRGGAKSVNCKSRENDGSAHQFHIGIRCHYGIMSPGRRTIP